MQLVVIHFPLFFSRLVYNILTLHRLLNLSRIP